MILLATETIQNAVVVPYAILALIVPTFIAVLMGILYLSKSTSSEIVGKSVSDLRREMEESHQEIEQKFVDHRKEISSRFDLIGDKLSEFKSSYDREVTVLTITQKTTTAHLEKLEMSMDKMDNKIDSLRGLIEQLIRDFKK